MFKYGINPVVLVDRDWLFILGNVSLLVDIVLKY